jgi:hypothetical protein
LGGVSLTVRAQLRATVTTSRNAPNAVIKLLFPDSVGLLFTGKYLLPCKRRTWMSGEAGPTHGGWHI